MISNKCPVKAKLSQLCRKTPLPVCSLALPLFRLQHSNRTLAGLHLQVTEKINFDNFLSFLRASPLVEKMRSFWLNHKLATMPLVCYLSSVSTEAAMATLNRTAASNMSQQTQFHTISLENQAQEFEFEDIRTICSQNEGTSTCGETFEHEEYEELMLRSSTISVVSLNSSI